jgi:inner membrane protein
MASLGHVAIGLAAARLADGKLGKGDDPGPRLASSMFVFANLAMLPDADVIGMFMGVPYDAPFGHRGASHSFVFAALAGWLAGLIADSLRFHGWRVGILAALVVATHGPLDALTDGGRGVALLWPFTDARYFFPWQPIPVAPIGIHFLSADGMECARTELLSFAPFWLYALFPRRWLRPRGSA